MEQDQVQEVLPSRLRDMMVAINYEKRRKRAERIEVFNRLNERFHEWVDQHKELAFQVSRDSKHNTGVEVAVVGFDDGLWTYGYSVQLSDRGAGSGINATNQMFHSREEAVKAGVVDVMQYLLRESVRNDITDGINAQLKRFIKASVEIVLGQKAKQNALF